MLCVVGVFFFLFLLFLVFATLVIIIIIIMSKDNIKMMSKDHNDNKCTFLCHLIFYILMYICMHEVGRGRSVSNIDGRWDIGLTKRWNMKGWPPPQTSRRWEAYACHVTVENKTSKSKTNHAKKLPFCMGGSRP